MKNRIPPSTFHWGYISNDMFGASLHAEISITGLSAGAYARPAPVRTLEVHCAGFLRDFLMRSFKTRWWKYVEIYPLVMTNIAMV